jgi:hypothetical protein
MRNFQARQKGDDAQATAAADRRHLPRLSTSRASNPQKEVVRPTPGMRVGSA